MEKFDLLLLLAFHSVLWIFLLAWFFEKIFQWDKATGKARTKLSWQWHMIKAVLVGEPAVIIAYLAYDFTWYAVIAWFFMASLMWWPFNFFLNKLRNLAPDHMGTNPMDKAPIWVQVGTIGLTIVLLIIFK